MKVRLSQRRLSLLRLVQSRRLIPLDGRACFRFCAGKRVEHGGERKTIGRGLGLSAWRACHDWPESERGGSRGHGAPPSCMCARADVRLSASCARLIVSAGPSALSLSPSPDDGSCELTTAASGAIRNSAATLRAAASKFASARSSFDAERPCKSAVAASYPSEKIRLAAR